MLKNGISLFVFMVLFFWVAGCGPVNQGEPTNGDNPSEPAGEANNNGHQDDDEHRNEEEHDDEHQHENEAELLTLPELNAVELDADLLNVVATTSIIGNVVDQVGGDRIDLTTLMAPGQDPHSYEPAARDLTVVSQADVVFVNGWDLEEGLVEDLENIGENVPLVPISANIAPLFFGDREHEGEEKHTGEEGEGEHGHEHSGADPHVWFSIANVQQWVVNARMVLSSLDPNNASIYESNANEYLAELEALAEFARSQMAQVPDENRVMVTNHDSFGYFAQEYGIEIIGTVLPGTSTIAEPSAGELAALIETMREHGLCSIFTETTVSAQLAETVAAELDNCDEVRIVSLYTGSIGPLDSEAGSYIGMFRANIEAIVNGLVN